VVAAAVAAAAAAAEDSRSKSVVDNHLPTMVDTEEEDRDWTHDTSAEVQHRHEVR
jgi:hypothetical protein